jgi:hypothetical protein
MIEKDMVRPKELMKRPTMPPMKATGTKTTTMEKVVAEALSRSGPRAC